MWQNLLQFLGGLGLVAAFRSIHKVKEETFCKGYLKRDTKTLDLMGVNFVGNYRDMLKEIRIASETFNTVRFGCSRFFRPFREGEDAFTPIIEKMPSNVKLVPVLIGRKQIYQVEYRKVLRGHASQLKAWLEYWLQDDFVEKYAYIDVFNEPRILYSVAIDWHKDLTLRALRFCRDRTDRPLAVGFGYSTRRKFVELCEPYCDYMTYHFYSDRADYKEDFRDSMSFYKKFGKPIVISEFNSRGGATRSHPEWYSEEEQACWLANVLHLIKQSDVKGYIVHDLHEPEFLDPYPPWGVFRKDWTPRLCFDFFP